MLFARVQDQLAIITVKAAMWSCVSVSGEAQAYRLTRTTALTSKQFAHRGGFSGLSVLEPCRLGNPEDRP